jgi:hypothetical protein
MKSYFYNEFDKSQNIFQPILQRSRQIYRGHRESGKINLEQDQFKMDVSRLEARIQGASTMLKTMSEYGYHHTSATPFTNAATPFFNAKYRIFGQGATPSSVEQTVLVEDILELSSNLNRILNKIKALENQEI